MLLGINKPDVRLVVHCGMPASLEDYYQQTGRAGRDGEPSRCVLMHHRNDAIRLHGIKLQGGSATAEAERQLRNRIAQMEMYCSKNRSLVSCRRSYLLRHFGEVLEGGGARIAACCDLCTAAREEEMSSAITGDGWVAKDSIHTTPSTKTDLGGEVLMLLRAVEDCGQHFALSTPIAILSGTKDQTVLQKVRGYSRMRSYGTGVMHSRQWWAALGDQLVDTEGLLAKELTRSVGMKFSYHKYIITEKGRALLWAYADWTPTKRTGDSCRVQYELCPSPPLQRQLYTSPSCWGPPRPSASTTRPHFPASGGATQQMSTQHMDLTVTGQVRRSGTLIRHGPHEPKGLARYCL